MTPAEYKEKLVNEYNQTVVNLQRLEGAIAACNAMLVTEDEPTTEDEATEE